jgi:hypothetical protein
MGVMSEEKKVERDERVAFEAEWKRSGWGDADTKNQCFHFWQARAASTSANGDRFDPYRLKVAEECCERLMSACTDAGCPDGVRMDDWIRENIRSTSANVAQGAEAVAWFTDDSQSDKSATTWDRNVAERWRAKGWPVSPLYAAPPAQPSTTDDARDAERYRFLRAGFGDMGPEVDMHNAFVDGGEVMDRTIDAALTAAQSGDKS